MWRDPTKRKHYGCRQDHAKDLGELGIIDVDCDEPPEGAHTDHAQAAEFWTACCSGS